MITEIEIGGYRLLDDFKADFKPLTVVIGANAVGKSTLIDCLQLIAECCEVPLNTAIGWHYGAASMLSANDVSKQISWSITFHHFALSEILQSEEKKLLVYQAELVPDTQFQMQARYEVLRNQELAPGHIEPFKFLEANPYRQQIFDRRQGKFTPFDEAQPSEVNVGETGSTETAHPSVPAQPTQQEVALLLSKIRFFNEFPVASLVRVLLANMTFYPGFDVTRSSSLRTKPADISPFTTLSSNGDNLGTVLHEILTRYDFRSAAEELREFLRVANPGFEEIHCDTTHGTPPQVLVGVREKGMHRSMNLWDLSDGMLRFLCLATALLNPLPRMLVAIDEPELGLHPGLLPVVAEMIKTASERTQVLVTTHSPDLLDCFDIEDVAVMARDEDDARVLWHRPADRATLVEMLKNVTGETLGDLHRSGELEAGV